MKKIFYLLAFASINLFANTKTEKLKKNDLKEHLRTFKIKEPNKSPYLHGWQANISCGGHMYTICCYTTESQAYSAGVAAANQVCQ